MMHLTCLLNEIRNPDSVAKAVAEYDRLGREAFLDKYGFGKARTYFLALGGRRYDSKAIVGAAYGFERPDQGPLGNADFSGGEETVGRKLDQLGFTVVVRTPEGAEIPLDRVSTTKLAAVVESEAQTATATGEFDPDSIEDARQRIMARIALRQGQPQFRRRLLEAYGKKCAISRCNCEEALEAAHIHPYRGTATNHVTNGILLRSDLHTLFDLGLIGIDTASFTVIVSKALKATTYAELVGKKVTLPAIPTQRPNRDLLDKHRNTFGL
jgi:hypothetical protein